MIRRIYGGYGEARYEGEIDTERIFSEQHGPQGFGYCVRLVNPVSSWMTATGALKEATGRHDGDGWRFWRISDTDEQILVLLH